VPSLRRTSLLLWVFWFCITFSYYGITIWLPNYLASKDLSGELYLNFLLMGLAELPGVFIASYLVDKIGRKYCLSGYMFGCGISTVFFGMVTSSIAVKILSMCIYFFVVGAWAVVYIFTPEVYPTALRTTASGVTSIFATTGGIVSPPIGAAILGNSTSASLVWIVLAIYASFFFLGGVVPLFIRNDSAQLQLQDVILEVAIPDLKQAENHQLLHKQGVQIVT